MPVRNPSRDVNPADPRPGQPPYFFDPPAFDDFTGFDFFVIAAFIWPTFDVTTFETVFIARCIGFSVAARTFSTAVSIGC